MTRVKICGLTRLEDALLAVELGASAVGFVLWPGSPRATTPAAVRAIADRLPALVTRVGVFVNATPDEVASAVRLARLDVAQLHGEESLDDYRGLGVRIIRAGALADDAAVERAAAWPPDVMPLVDAADDVRRGGTGRRADWGRAAALAARRPMLLAGGLQAGNVAEAIRTVGPWGIDVSSGVEDAPGLKNAARMRDLFAALAGR